MTGKFSTLSYNAYRALYQARLDEIENMAYT